MTLHERVYRSLLRAYPRSFRYQYADLMVQLFIDQVRDARAGHGPGLAGLWLRSGVDVFSNAAAHHFRKERPVSLSYFSAMTILLGIALLALMSAGPIVAIPLFAMEIASLAVFQRRTGHAVRPSIQRPSRVIFIGVVLIGVPTALMASPLVSGLEWGTMPFGAAWMCWAVASIVGLAFVTAGLVQVTSNALARRRTPRAA